MEISDNSQIIKCYEGLLSVISTMYHHKCPFLIIHLNISGKDDNDLQPSNMLLIWVTLIVFHLDISGKDDNDEQLLNIPFISIRLLVLHLDISGKDDNDEQ